MTTTDEPSLLAAILTQPDEDTVRLVYADWLDENGQPERAEFIRVQCELATIEAGEPRDRDSTWLTGYRWGMHKNLSVFAKLFGDGVCHCHHCLSNRVEELTTHADDWVPHVNALWDWHRGFVRGLTCAASDWLTHATTITAQHPIRAVTLTTWAPSFHIDGEYPAGGGEFRPRAIVLEGEGTDFARIAWNVNYRQDSLDTLKFFWPKITFTLP